MERFSTLHIFAVNPGIFLMPESEDLTSSVLSVVHCLVEL